MYLLFGKEIIDNFMKSQSEFGKLKSVFIKSVTEAFISDTYIAQYWKDLNYLEAPQYEKAVAEYADFEKIFKDHGVKIYHLPKEDSVNIDSIYCRDAAIATNYGMIICNMGKPARNQEPKAEQAAFEKEGIPILGVINAPGTIEGGDVAWIDEHTLAVGYTYRTNEEGIRQLKSLLEPKGVQVVVANMPHYKGPADVFHLMSVFSPIDQYKAVVYSPLIPIDFRNLLLNKGYELIEVPETEFDSMGCNVLAIAPSLCIMVKGNEITKKRIEAAGCTVIEYAGAEISVKGGGGPTCLTRPIEREY